MGPVPSQLLMGNHEMQDGEAEKHRSMVSRVITLASRLSSSPRLLEAFLVIGEKMVEIGDWDQDCWAELMVVGQVKAGELSHVKLGLTRSYQIKKDRPVQF